MAKSADIRGDKTKKPKQVKEAKPKKAY